MQLVEHRFERSAILVLALALVSGPFASFQQFLPPEVEGLAKLQHFFGGEQAWSVAASGEVAVDAVERLRQRPQDAALAVERRGVAQQRVLAGAAVVHLREGRPHARHIHLEELLVVVGVRGPLRIGVGWHPGHMLARIGTVQARDVGVRVILFSGAAIVVVARAVEEEAHEEVHVTGLAGLADRAKLAFDFEVVSYVSIMCSEEHLSI
ncbi:hypothetical protein D9M69_568860 [compost metagenome]